MSKRSRSVWDVEMMGGMDTARVLMLLAQHHQHYQRGVVGAQAAEAPIAMSARVFECKTCNRQFPTFQALGGHRASHKRPRLHLQQKQQQLLGDGAALCLGRRTVAPLPPPPRQQQPARPKAHECPVCGLEFAVGQALGGHMRRHRAEAEVAALGGKATPGAGLCDEAGGICLDLNLTPSENCAKCRSVAGAGAAMLTAPNKKKRPLFAAKDIQAFYMDNSPKIFPQVRGAFGRIMRTVRLLSGPCYDGKYLHEVLRKKLGNTRLHQTLTNVVIPTFDIKRLQPTIFSSYEVKKKNTMDALLSDICISTSAAPTYLPAHYFKTEDYHGNITEFNLIDGGVAANNPALVAIGEVTKQIYKENPAFFPIKPLDYGRFLVISLGTGSSKFEERYSSQKAKSWGVLGWLLSSGSTPLVDIFTRASADMVDIHIASVFKALRSEQNYLRIQDDTLRGTLSSVDVATKDNLEKLVSVGEMLLKKSVSRANLETGHMVPFCCDTDLTNEEALKRFAKLLSDERRIRQARSPK